MTKAAIFINVKKNLGKRHTSTIDVQYDSDMAEIKIEEIGEAISSLNKSADVTVSYSVFNEISGTWMELMAYYANEKRIVKF
tara:strand:- start:880 stop:1125 length:246 start_codon:yes stop_codon:yes gene_type:complete